MRRRPARRTVALLMLGLLAGGLGLVARSLRPQGPGVTGDDSWAA